jgi:hypothetical protein
LLLLLLLLLIGLQMLESLQQCLHQMVLVGNELLDLRVGLVVGVAALAIAVVPCVHHLRAFQERQNEILGLDRIPNYMLRKMQMLSFFSYYYIKETCSHGQGAEATHDSHQHTHLINPIINHHTNDD